MAVDKQIVREQFRSKLIQALRDQHIRVHGQGAWLARAMNVTTKAAQRWLVGETMPHPGRWPELAVILDKDPGYFAYDIAVDDINSMTETESTVMRGMAGTMEEADLLNGYRKLKRSGQLAVLATLHQQLEQDHGAGG